MRRRSRSLNETSGHDSRGQAQSVLAEAMCGAPAGGSPRLPSDDGLICLSDRPWLAGSAQPPVASVALASMSGITMRVMARSSRSSPAR